MTETLKPAPRHEHPLCPECTYLGSLEVDAPGVELGMAIWDFYLHEADLLGNHYAAVPGPALVPHALVDRQLIARYGSGPWQYERTHPVRPSSVHLLFAQHLAVSQGLWP